MFCRRCPTMVQPPFISRKKAKDSVSLGAYDPKLFTLIYAVIASAADTVFRPDNNPDFQPINIYQRTFTSVRLVVLWTFFCIPAWGALTEHVATQQPDPANPQFLTGDTANECMGSFIKSAITLTNAQMESIVATTATNTFAICTRYAIFQRKALTIPTQKFLRYRANGLFA